MRRARATSFLWVFAFFVSAAARAELAGAPSPVLRFEPGAECERYLSYRRVAPKKESSACDRGVELDGLPTVETLLPKWSALFQGMGYTHEDAESVSLLSARVQKDTGSPYGLFVVVSAGAEGGRLEPVAFFKQSDLEFAAMKSEDPSSVWCSCFARAFAHQSGWTVRYQLRSAHCSPDLLTTLGLRAYSEDGPVNFGSMWCPNHPDFPAPYVLCGAGVLLVCLSIFLLRRRMRRSMRA